MSATFPLPTPSIVVRAIHCVSALLAQVAAGARLRRETRNLADACVVMGV